ncbi:hypothetical protein [Nonomuraea pusilla]|uniref:hypothetical protein n=1 Tax=Nonomuraea pusilla TaxID=46177 RepID=UPI003D9E4A9C
MAHNYYADPVRRAQPVPRPPVRDFAALLTHAAANDTKLIAWIATAWAADLLHLNGFTDGLEVGRDTVKAALVLPYRNGRTEGVSTRTERIMRQTHRCALWPRLMLDTAGDHLLHHRILLRW